MDHLTFMGYRRENGGVGVRNHVAVIPMDGLSNTAAMNVAKITHGVEALTHPFGEGQFGKDLELFFQTVIGVGSNPNVASAIVIGIEPNWTDKVNTGISATGKPVASFSIEGYGDFVTIERAARKAREFIQYASELQPQKIDLSEIVMSIKCGESDTTNGLASNPAVGKVVERLLEFGATIIFGETTELTGAEHFVKNRIQSFEQQEKFQAVYDEYVGFIKSQNADLFGSQPTQGNIRGGLSTIEEKALGNIQKIGKAGIAGVLEPAEAPPEKGLWFMNTSSTAAEVLTLFAAAGSVVNLFPTGQGNVIGNPVMPVIKLTANPLTASSMAEHIDVNISDVLTRKITTEQAGEMLMDMLVRTANGRLTSSEVLGHREFL
ncbi:MAG: UxaA family hydrolase, partial [Candidatus Desulforudis sp.]|nr:UxaA family hydrolase [Desulforudis sp.]